MWEGLPVLQQELTALEDKLQALFGSKKANTYLNRLSLDIIRSGGKRLRPALTIGAAMLGQYDREKALHAAASIELLHSATLVHDDIIDKAPLRRSRPTVYASEGVSTAVFTGDYLLVKAVLSLVEAGLPADYLKQVAKGIEAVCVGEVEQFTGRGSIAGFKTYLSRIIRKTGVLFAASCLLGAQLAGLDEKTVKKAMRFGIYYGIAFQIKDDILNMTEKEIEAGKPVGNDLKDGIVTLPVLLAAAKDDLLKLQLTAFLGKQNSGHFSRMELSRIVKAVHRSNGVQEASDILRKYVEKAGRFLHALPDSQGRDILGKILYMTFS